MKYSIRVLRRAQSDVDHIHAWLRQRSQAGATRWYAAFIKAAASLRHFPEACGVATDAEFDEVIIRERPFKTPRGRSYRILFTVVGEEVLILRVRGPAQPPLTWGEFQL